MIGTRGWNLMDSTLPDDVILIAKIYFNATDFSYFSQYYRSRRSVFSRKNHHRKRKIFFCQRTPFDDWNLRDFLRVNQFFYLQKRDSSFKNSPFIVCNLFFLELFSSFGQFL